MQYAEVMRALSGFQAPHGATREERLGKFMQIVAARGSSVLIDRRSGVNKKANVAQTCETN